MAGQDHSKNSREGKVTNNGTEPNNQYEEENIVEGSFNSMFNVFFAQFLNRKRYQ